MHYSDLLAIEADGNQITRALDLDDAQPIEVPGGDVVFVTELARTDNDQALHPVGNLPIASTSVYDREQLTDALVEAGYPDEYVEFAAGTPLGDSGPLAARLAESRDHDHPAAIESVATGERALTDGGEDETETVIDANGDKVPARTETADFGGGEGGIEEL